MGKSPRPARPRLFPRPTSQSHPLRAHFIMASARVMAPCAPAQQVARPATALRAAARPVRAARRSACRVVAAVKFDYPTKVFEKELVK